MESKKSGSLALFEKRREYTYKQLEDLELASERLLVYNSFDNLGRMPTFLALKSDKPLSFMVATSTRGMEVYENGLKLYSRKQFGKGKKLKDLIYLNHLDCYLLALGSKIYRKDINKKHPYPFINVDCSGRNGACFKYSPLNQRLIVCKEGENISVVHLWRRQVELWLDKPGWGVIHDFRVFGETENKVIAVGKGGHVYRYHLNYGQRKLCQLTQTQIQLEHQRGEEALSVEVCDKNQYAVVAVGDLVGERKRTKSSRIYLFHLAEGALIQKGVIDQYDQNVEAQSALGCFGYFGSHALWAGLTDSSSDYVRIYYYDTEFDTFDWLYDKKDFHPEYKPLKVQRFGLSLYFSGENRRIVKLTLAKEEEI